MDRENFGMLRNWICQALIDNDTDMNIEDQVVQLGLAADGEEWKERHQAEFDGLYGAALEVVNSEDIRDEDRGVMQGMLSVVIGEVFTGPDMWKEALEDGWVFIEEGMGDEAPIEMEQKCIDLWRQVRDLYKEVVQASLDEVELEHP